MKKTTILFTILSISLLTICKGNEVEIIFAIKPSDCISCMAPIKDILAEIERQQLLEQVIFVVRDVPQKTLPSYTQEVLKLPSSLKFISSETLFSKYSYCNASAITVIDNSTTPIQRLSFPLYSYFANRTLFVDRLSKCSKTLIEPERVKLNELLGGVRMVSLANDSVLLVNDKVFNTVSLFSIESGKSLGKLTLDSAFYTAPYIKNDIKINEIWKNQHILEKASFPRYLFKGVFNQYGKTIISTVCYYPFSEGKDFYILPKNLFITLDTLLTPSSYRWLYIDKANPIVNFYNAVIFKKDNLLTTTLNTFNNQQMFNPEFIYNFKPVGDSLVFQQAIHVDPPNFTKGSYSAKGLSLNYVSEYQGREVIWYSYYPEFYDLITRKWVSLDSCYASPKMTTNSFAQDHPINFQVLGIWSEANQYSMILCFGLQVYYATQSFNSVTQSTLIHTIKDGHQFNIVRKSETEFIGIEHNQKTGEADIIVFPYIGIQLHNYPFVNK